MAAFIHHNVSSHFFRSFILLCFRLITAGTIEENIFQRSFIKQNLCKVMVDERGITCHGEESKEGMEFCREELRELLTYNEQFVVKPLISSINVRRDYGRIITAFMKLKISHCNKQFEKIPKLVPLLHLCIQLPKF